VDEPTRPNGASALAATSVLASAATGAQARANGERAEFTTANAYTIEQTNERAAAPQDYGDDDDGAPIGPSEEEEAAFLAEEDPSSHLFGAASVSRAEKAFSARVEADVAEKNFGSLPNLDELRTRIAPEILGLMEELFRAKLTRVVRVSARDLKGAKRSQ